jgi:DNA invertase Pin-like site-specific DNA recombinase
MTERDTIKRRIEGAARKRVEASRAREIASEELRRYCREGQALGVPVAEMAALAGISRQAVYNFLDEEAPSAST